MPYIMTLVSLFAADSIMKCWIEKYWENSRDSGKKHRIGIVLKKYHNRGAMLNMGDKNQSFVALLSLVFSAFVTGVFTVTLGMKGRRLLNTGLALILGGAYSNTRDRLRRKYVVDYVSFPVTTKKDGSRIRKALADRFSSVVFNLADLGIMLGAMLLVISELTRKETGQGKE